MVQQDPYFIVRDRIQANLSIIEDIRWARHRPSKPSNFLRHLLNDIDRDLKDLDGTISVVQANRLRFPSIDDKELQSRMAFVEKSKSKWNVDHQWINELLRKSNVGKVVEFTDFTDSHNAVPVKSSTHQIEIEAKQELILDDMSKSLDRLGSLSTNINKQLREHQDLLNDTQSEMDQAQNMMSIISIKLKKLLRSTDNGRWCCLAGLVILALLLFILVFFTK